MNRMNRKLKMNITSRFGRPGFRCGDIRVITLFRLPKLCECCLCFFLVFGSQSAEFNCCNDN